MQCSSVKKLNPASKLPSFFFLPPTVNDLFLTALKVQGAFRIDGPVWTGEKTISRSLETHTVRNASRT